METLLTSTEVYLLPPTSMGISMQLNLLQRKLVETSMDVDRKSEAINRNLPCRREVALLESVLLAGEVFDRVSPAQYIYLQSHT